MKIIRSFNEWCDEALRLLKNSKFCYIASFNLNYTEALNDKVFDILTHASTIKHNVLIGISTMQCIPNCPHCILNNINKYQNVDRLKSITSNYRIVQELHMKVFITSNGVIVGGMNMTGSGWIDRAFVTAKSSLIDELKDDFMQVYNTAKQLFEEWKIYKLPQDFIERYIKECNKGNVIKEVMLEYEPKRYEKHPNDTKEEDMKAFEEAKTYEEYLDYGIKLRSNNTVIIHPIEERKYTKEDMDKAFTAGYVYSSQFDWDRQPYPEVEDLKINPEYLAFDKWLNKQFPE